MKADLKIFLFPAVFIILFYSSNDADAQDVNFSQYYSSSLYLNPAFSGIESKLTLNANSRTQWKSIVTPYTTNQVSLIVPINTKGLKERHLGGIGLSVYNFKAGEGKFQTLGANLNFGYNLQLSSLHHIAFGAQGGFVQKSIQPGNFQWGTQYNSFLGGYDQSVAVDMSNINSSSSFADFAGGVMYYYNPARDYEEKGVSIYGGIAAYHITRPNESMLKDTSNKLPLLLRSHAGFELNLSEKFNISPNILIASQNQQMQINAGMYLTFLFGDQEARVAPAFMLLGGWYRVKDSYILSAGVGNSVYTVGFSYDLNNSSLRYNTQGRGAYEISLKLQKPGSNKKIRIYNPLL
jgi:type IX secretion system PorP/SprF family membrane protein